MKAKFFALAALVLGLASCQNDFDGVKQNAKGEVNFELSVAAPDLGTTRAGENGLADNQQAFDSAFGAIDYLQGAVRGDQLRVDWDDVDLRYTLEVYDKADDYTDAKPIKDRMVIIKDSYEAVKFELRLVPNRDYHFVLFADFVEDGLWEETDLDQGYTAQANLGKHHIIGETLADITITEDGINDECTDAYFATKDIKVSNAAPQQIVLKRPYGKLRVIATDLAELNLNVEPKSVKVAYTAKHPQSFNALTGEIGDVEEKEEYWFEFESIYEDVYKEVDKGGLQNHFYTAGYDNYDNYGMINDNGVKRHTHMTLFTDYILAEDEQNAYHFEMEVYDAKGALIKATEFATDIPVQRNFLTTVIGNVLTTATDIEVRIDDNFAGYYEYQLWDGKAIAEPKKVDGVYEIYEASELAWLAAQVNGGTRAAGVSFQGETFRLMKDIHLNDERWTAIGTTGCKFSGTFDGNNHKIEGLFVYETGKVSAGLFGYCPSATIKNLTVLNAEVYGNYKAAVIVADAVCTKIENCHVNDAIVLSTPYEKNDANNVGAIAGYLAADGGTAYVKDCTVKNAKITAYRKVGGIVGAANLASEVTGNYIESSYITADMTAEYSEDKPADAGRIIGWKHANVKDENNTYAGQTETVANALAVRVIVMPKADKIADYINNSEEFIVMLPNGTYLFTADVEENKTLQASGTNVTLNVDGHNLNLGDPNNYGLIANMGAEVVVNDANIVSGGGAIAAADGSKVTVNGGSAYIDSSSTSGRYIFYAYGEGSVITVNGGSYSWDPADNLKRAYVYCAAGAKVIINDGTFGKASTRSGYSDGIMGDGETIIYGGTFGFNPTRWVAEGCTVTKEGSNWVVKAPVVVEDAAGLADAIANAEGSTIALSENVNYGAVTAGELKNVTIKGAEGAVMIFKTTADSKLENVTLKGVNFEYTGATADCGIVIDANAQIDNLVVDGCTFVGTGAKAGRGISGLNNNASIKLTGCTFEDLGYPIYAWGSYKSLEIDGCTFNRVVSWAIMPQSGFDGDLTVNGCNFNYCKGGLIKAGTLTAGHTFTFTNNTVTNSEEHPHRNWFEFKVSAGTSVISGNIMDGDPWTPGTAEGLK